VRALRVGLVVVIVAFTIERAWTPGARAQSAIPEPPVLRCLEPVEGVTWQRWMDGTDATLNAWCATVGKPVLQSPVYITPADIARLQIVSWNTHVGGGRLEDLLDLLGQQASGSGTGLVLSLQETFRDGWDVPESYPDTVRVPDAIRPRRPAPDIAALGMRLGLFTAYVPSMRNGSSTSLDREDRGNAILSTEPISDVVAIELPFGHQRRVALAATVTPRGSHGRPVRVLNAHIDTGSHRVMQSEALAAIIGAFVDGRAMPLIVTADLNSKKGLDDRAVAIVSARIHREDDCGTGRTFRLPLRFDALLIGRLDYVFSTLDQFGITSTCETLGRTLGSDHVPVVVTLRVGEQ
jgi:endonuclease/exonuclease/phosphatase family metal-dependent hydrolase